MWPSEQASSGGEWENGTILEFSIAFKVLLGGMALFIKCRVYYYQVSIPSRSGNAVKYKCLLVSVSFIFPPCREKYTLYYGCDTLITVHVVYEKYPDIFKNIF